MSSLFFIPIEDNKFFVHNTSEIQCPDDLSVQQSFHRITNSDRIAYTYKVQCSTTKIVFSIHSQLIPKNNHKDDAWIFTATNRERERVYVVHTHPCVQRFPSSTFLVDCVACAQYLKTCSHINSFEPIVLWPSNGVGLSPEFFVAPKSVTSFESNYYHLVYERLVWISMETPSKLDHY